MSAILSKRSQGLFFLMTTLLLFLNCSIFAQPASIPQHSVPYTVTSGAYHGTNSFVFRATISIKQVPWMRIVFDQTSLGQNSYVVIRSIKDGSTQHLDTKSLLEWKNTSAYFNGDAVEIELYAGTGDQAVSVGVSEAIVGDYVGSGNGATSICGTSDDRTSSSTAAVGRIIPIGCTGWIVANGLHVTAGHCFVLGSSDVIEFNVPASLSDGTIQHPAAQHQYSINQSSVVYTYNGVGDDWAVFRVYDNPQSNKQPIDAQGASFSVVQDLNPNTFRVTGYGVDGPAPNFGNPPPLNSDNQTQQTHTGANNSSSGTTLYYSVDTQGGNSGSPVIDESTGKAVGVHTNAGCTSSGGSNAGTSCYNTNFWDAIGFPITLDQKRFDGTRLSGTTIGQWNGVAFSELTLTGQPIIIKSRQREKYCEDIKK